MKLKKIKFTNFRLFENFELDFPDENFIVIIGGNGSGKSTILDGIARCIEHFVTIMTSNMPNGHNIDTSLNDLDIKIGQQTTTVNSTIEAFNSEFAFQILKNKNLAGSAYEITDEKFLIDKRKQIESGDIRQYPVLGYLDINRSNSISQTTKRDISSPLLSEVYDTMMLNVSNFSFVNDWYVAASTEETFIRSNEKNFAIELPSLKYFRQAFSKFFSHLDTPFRKLDIQIREGLSYQPNSKSTFFFGIQKGDTVLNFNQLSSGEKSIINIVFAIAQKLIKANRTSDNPLDGNGMILIDELDLHLHPSWQAQIVKALKATFPNIQFIVTTHSPLVLSGVRKQEIIMLNSSGQESPTDKVPNLFGATANEIFKKLMFSVSRNPEVDPYIQKLDDLILQENYEAAEILLSKLKNQYSTEDWKDYEQIVAFSKV